MFDTTNQTPRVQWYLSDFFHTRDLFVLTCSPEMPFVATLPPSLWMFIPPKVQQCKRVSNLSPGMFCPKFTHLYPFIIISPRNVQVTQPFLQFVPSHIVLPADLGLNGLQGLQMLAGLGGGASPGGGRKGSARLLPLELRTNLCRPRCPEPGRGWIFDLNRDPWWN
jgi:hypothetical protein